MFSINRYEDNDPTLAKNIITKRDLSFNQTTENFKSRGFIDQTWNKVGIFEENQYSLPDNSKPFQRGLYPYEKRFVRGYNVFTETDHYPREITSETERLQRINTYEDGTPRAGIVGDAGLVALQNNLMDIVKMGLPENKQKELELSEFLKNRFSALFGRRNSITLAELQDNADNPNFIPDPVIRERMRVVLEEFRQKGVEDVSIDEGLVFADEFAQGKFDDVKKPPETIKTSQSIAILKQRLNELKGMEEVKEADDLKELVIDVVSEIGGEDELKDELTELVDEINSKFRNEQNANASIKALEERINALQVPQEEFETQAFETTLNDLFKNKIFLKNYEQNNDKIDFIKNELADEGIKEEDIDEEFVKSKIRAKEIKKLKKIQNRRIPQKNNTEAKINKWTEYAEAYYTFKTFKSGKDDQEFKNLLDDIKEENFNLSSNTIKTKIDKIIKEKNEIKL